MPDGDIAIGLVGAGHIARLIHLPVLAGLTGLRVAAVADPDGDALVAAGAIATGARLCADIGELLAGPALDGVVVCSPTDSHAEIARAAFGAGWSVYLEKPIATTLDDGRAVVAAQEQAASVGMTGFMLRFSPAFAQARTLIAAGEIGEVVGAQSVFTSPPRDTPAWRRARAGGGGALLDLLSHHADLTRWLFGSEVATVAAQVRSVRTEDDTACVRMVTASGVTMQTFVSTAAAEDHRVEIVGTAGRLTVDPWRMGTPERFGAEGGAARLDRLRRLTPRRLLHRPDYHGPFRGALAAFADGVRHGHSPRPDLGDGLASLAIVDAAERAARSGAETEVEATAHVRG
jgi:myo-inositol 2-dehydrogenase/D-chiro-inositol 1-dehydrogenase